MPRAWSVRRSDAVPRASCKRRALALAAAVLLVLVPAARAQPQEPSVSLAGKQIRLLIGFSPTGYGYDTYGRLLARHLGKYLPGGASVVAVNKPGGGSL